MRILQSRKVTKGQTSKKEFLMACFMRKPQAATNEPSAASWLVAYARLNQAALRKLTKASARRKVVCRALGGVLRSMVLI